MAETFAVATAKAQNASLAAHIDKLIPILGDTYEEQITSLARIRIELLAGAPTLPRSTLFYFAQLGYDVLTMVWLEKNKDEVDRRMPESPAGAAANTEEQNAD